ncbi:DNA methyltransferase [Croceibacter phage P2559S]|uniref:DNA methyltransferase n=1 Tax=Croceibacter phage P2559S TaxID=1176422 RepID=UPI0002688ECF|nr:DNA methyltransferase [Croceibacter phage P2559S]AFM54830.1 hypothetical protein P2559S_52 [Croceibacter phage P2559S]
MPSGSTFDIPPILKFIGKYNALNIESADPFANTNKIAKYTNDIDESTGAGSNMEALEFLKTFADKSLDLVLFDPPYSPRQVSECYKKLGRTVNMETTQASFWSDCKNEIARILKPAGVVLCFGWNSQGVGKKRGFTMEEILLVAHGGQHNDTICTAERKNLDLFS